jgi:hypothetical protein
VRFPFLFIAKKGRMFFFEKKNQKTFAHCGHHSCPRVEPPPEALGKFFAYGTSTLKSAS